MKLPIIISITILLFLTSCGDDNESKQVSDKEFTQIETRIFNKKSQLISMKYGIEEEVVKNVIRNYLNNFEPWEYSVITGGKFAKVNNDVEFIPKREMWELISQVARDNRINESVTADIIFDYITLKDVSL